MTTNRLVTIFSVVLVWMTIVPQNALASQSKAQLYLPWPMLNTKMNSVLSESKTNFSTKVAATTLKANGINWLISNAEYFATTTKTPVIDTNGSALQFDADQASLKVTVEKLSVDQVVKKEVDGAIVNVHLKATCGPLTFTQPSAKVTSLFKIDWATGSPKTELQKSTLYWVPDSWIIQDFTCVGPKGLPEKLKTEILARLKNADDFRDDLNEFIGSRAQGIVDDSLGEIRKPFTFSASSTKQTFKVGKLFSTSQGLIADLTMSNSTSLPALPAKALPSTTVLGALSKINPTLLAGKEVLEQIVRDELNAKPATIKNDLQNNAAFHALMQDRLKQTFGWQDLTKYSKNSPFPTTLYKPTFNGLTLTSDGKLQTTFALNGVVQSYRESQWWTWLDLKGQGTAKVTLSVSSGKVAYSTNLTTSANTAITYSDVYRNEFDKGDKNPPSKEILDAVSGDQPSLSGSYVFPTIEISNAGSYQISGLKWINSANFVLNFQAR